jgi:hypothetical protein
VKRRQGDRRHREVIGQACRRAGSCREATISVRGRLGTTPDRICRLNQNTIAVTPGQCWQARAARSNTVWQALPVAGRERKKAMSHARGRARLGRALRKSERAQARSLYPQSHCAAPPGEATTDSADETAYRGSVEVRQIRRQIREPLNLLKKLWCARRPRSSSDPFL